MKRSMLLSFLPEACSSYGSFRYFERAQAAFEAALKMDPSVRRGHYYLGTVKLLAAGRDALEPAIGHFQRAQALAPEDPMTNLYLGTALLATRRFEAAICWRYAVANYRKFVVDESP